MTHVRDTKQSSRRSAADRAAERKALHKEKEVEREKEAKAKHRRSLIIQGKETPKTDEERKLAGESVNLNPRAKEPETPKPKAPSTPPAQPTTTPGPTTDNLGV